MAAGGADGGIDVAMPPGMDPTTPLPSESTGRRVLVRGRRWHVVDVARSVDCAAVRLREIGHDRAQTLLTPFDRPRPIDGEPRPRMVRPRRWLHELDRALLQLHPFGSLHAAAQAPIRILPYQLEPALAMLRDGAARVLVADGVGLGKTIQAGLLLLELAHRHESCRALVLVPAGLRDQWLAELSTRFRLVPILADTAWLRSVSTERPAHVNPWSLPGIYVASQDLVKRPEVLRPLEDVTWDAVVIDEAHAAATGTDRRAAIHAIASRARHVMLLTATPHGGDPGQFEALCRIGCTRNNAERIVLLQRTRADVSDGQPRKTTILTVIPSGAERRMHDLLDRYSSRVWKEAGGRGDDRARLVSIVLRKRALSSAGSLGASVERRLALLSDRSDPWQLPLPLDPLADEDPLDDDAPAAALAAPGLADPKLERRLLTAVAEAARLAASDERKTRFLLRLLRRIEEPAIVFTEYRDTLARLERRVASEGHAVAVLHGGMTPADRGRVQRMFNERGGTLLATDAASEGLNLHHSCRVIIHYELPWNPARLEQRAGRVDRLGQTRRVHELALVATHTAERLVLAPLITRLAAAGPGRGRLLGALTESRVAAAVMTNMKPTDLTVGIDDTPLQCAAAAPENLAPHAVEEAARLEHNRSLAARSRRNLEPDTGCRAVVSVLERRPALPRGLFLVFALTLARPDGSPVHAEPRIVRVELDSRFFHHPPSAGLSARPRVVTRRLSEVVSVLAGSDTAIIRSLILQNGADHFDRMTALDERRRERQRGRERAIEDLFAADRHSAARQLVQAGLFDRRALRAAALHAAAAATQQEERTERAAAAAADVASLQRRTELIAVLLVPDLR